MKRRGWGRKEKKKAKKPPFGLEKPPSGRGPALTRSTWLATFPFPAPARKPKGPAWPQGGPEASGVVLPEGGQGSGISPHCGEATARGWQARRGVGPMPSPPRLWNSAAATYLDARRNLATGAPRLRRAAPPSPARSPPPARCAPAPPPAVSVATAPDAGAAGAGARGGADAAAAALGPDEGARPRRTRPARARRTGPAPSTRSASRVPRSRPPSDV